MVILTLYKRFVVATTENATIHNVREISVKELTFEDYFYNRWRKDADVMISNCSSILMTDRISRTYANRNVSRLTLSFLYCNTPITSHHIITEMY